MIEQAVCPQCGAANRIGHGHDVGKAKCGKCSTPLQLGHPIEVDDAALARHLKRNKGPVLVDVWAPWCGPCRAMAPNFEAAAETLAGEARLLKLNADNSQTSRKLGVSGIPALLLFEDGELVDRKAGLMPTAQIVNWIRSRAGSPAERRSS